ncbi:MAG: hypothetical protein ABSB74_19470, partial [Tepidisphaeraceae bacterium]
HRPQIPGLGSIGQLYNLHAAGFFPLALSGTGTLTVAGQESVGNTGTFNQSGGTNIASQAVDLGGTYSLSGGSLTAGAVPSGPANYGEYIDGTFNQSGGTNSIVSSQSLYLGHQSGAHGTYLLSAGTLSVTGNALVGDGGTGTFSLSATGSLSVVGSEYIGDGGAGTFIQSGGTNTLPTPITYEIVGYTSNGTYIQTGGLNDTTFATFGVGGNGVTGTYSLSGTGVLENGNYEGIGGSGSGGNGSFIQSGGTNSIISSLFDVDGYSGGNGFYSLSGGSLMVLGGEDNVGVSGNGTFIQSGGLHQVGDSGYPSYLSIGGTAGNGIYSLSGTGTLTVTLQEFIGSTGTFSQSGGTSIVSEAINVSGTYLLSGGSLTAGGPLTVSSTGRVTINGGTNTVGGLSIATGGGVNLNSALFINYGSYGGGTDPVATIRAYLINGRNGGGWNGASGIDSSSAAANYNYAVGYADSADPGNPAGLASGTIEIKYTLLGDATLTGTVTGTDFTILATNLGKVVSGWDQGDFLYTGTVTGADFTALVANLGKTASGGSVVLPAADWAAVDAFAAANGLMADVPEPASASVIVLAGIGVLGRRTRRRQKRRVEMLR